MPYRRRIMEDGCMHKPHLLTLALALLAIASAAPAKPPQPWVEGSETIAVLPDTQYYTVEKMSSGRCYRDRFPAQTRWIAENRDKRGIKYVFHLGDIVQNNTPDQWKVARDAFDLIEGKVPYAIVPGNHDYSGDRTATLINKYFSTEKTARWPTFGGSMENGKIDNTYHLFEIHGVPWIVVALECLPRKEALEWADKVLAKHKDRFAILITHAYLDGQDRRITFEDYGRLAAGMMWQSDGEKMWEVVKKYPRMMLVISGHVANDGDGYLASKGDHGNVVHQFLVDYQSSKAGGNGYMRLLEFLPDGRSVQSKTWSPYTKHYRSDKTWMQFDFKLQPAPGDANALRPRVRKPAANQPATPSEPGYSSLIKPGPNGKLVYAADANGNVIPDFSHAGYRGGGVAIPEAKVVVTVAPKQDGDDTQRMEKAIEDVSARPVGTDGLRGAVLLKRGKYRVSRPLTISTDGVVVRGEGRGEDGTVLTAWGGKFDTTFVIKGSGEGARFGIEPRSITDAYLPAGTKSFTVDSAEGYKPGDRVVIDRPATKQWLARVGGDKLGWNAGYGTRYERRITSVKGNRVTIDVPLVEPLVRAIAQGRMCKYTYPNRLRNVGVEQLRIETGGQGVDMDHVEDAWVRDVTVKAFMYSCVSVRCGASRITIQDCSYLDPVGPIKGGYRYGFNLAGQLTLVQRCYARNGRHDFVMHALARGPNVFLDCFSEHAHSDSGPHHRWSVGTLYDNVCVRGNGLTAKYAGTRGTGHGWTGVQMVFFNCIGDYINVQDPPLAQNYCIGCKGERSGPQYRGTQGHWESWQKRVAPRSLYLSQLRDRLGDKAVGNITIPQQRSGTIRTYLRRRIGS